MRSAFFFGMIFDYCGCLPSVPNGAANLEAARGQSVLPTGGRTSAIATAGRWRQRKRQYRVRSSGQHLLAAPTAAQDADSADRAPKAATHQTEKREPWFSGRARTLANLPATLFRVIGLVAKLGFLAHGCGVEICMLIVENALNVLGGRLRDIRRWESKTTGKIGYLRQADERWRVSPVGDGALVAQGVWHIEGQWWTGSISDLRLGQFWQRMTEHECYKIFLYPI